MLDVTKPSVLQKLCVQYRLTPSKGYGQNFLITDAPIKKMIEAAELKTDDKVVEIGPGFGVLTFALAERVKKVIAFEIERKLEGYWSDLEIYRDMEINRDKIEIVWGNALKNFQFSIFNFQFPYKIVANIPYQITSQLLKTILELENKPELIVIMVQKEVAERICARKGEMSLLSVAVQYYGEPKIIAKVPAGSFWPRPKVESAILRITTSSHHFITSSQRESDKEFFRVVRAGFAQKRKQLWSNLARGLKLDGDKVKTVLRGVVGNEKVRAEELGVEEWERIVKLLLDNSISCGRSRVPHSNSYNLS